MSALLNDTLTIDATPAGQLDDDSNEVVYAKFIVSGLYVDLRLAISGIDPVSATPSERSEAKHQIVRDFIAGV